jgi:synaptojanin
LYRGDQLELSAYSSADVRSSDHRPVYALFRAAVRIIDFAKRTALSQQLLRNVTSTAQGEKLEDKLANLAFNDNKRESIVIDI